MLLYVFTFIGFLILLPILYLIPIGIHRTGKLVLAVIALVSSNLFILSSQMIPIWQAAFAVFVLIVAATYLLNKKDLLFSQEQDDDFDENIFDDSSEKAEVISIDNVVEPDSIAVEINESENMNNRSNDLSEPVTENPLEEVAVAMIVEKTVVQPLDQDEQDFLDEFFNQLDSSDNKLSKVDENESKIIISEVTASQESSEEKDSEQDYFFAELFEDRVSVKVEPNSSNDILGDHLDESKMESRVKRGNRL
ncbi:MAG: hypothetical protein ACQEWV_06480 [Bacillota bacterium]